MGQTWDIENVTPPAVHADLLADLRTLRAAGIHRARSAEMPALAALASWLADEVTDSSALIEPMLRQALERAGDGDYTRSAEFLLGLAPGTRGRELTERRYLAAEQLEKTAETFRRRHENDLLSHLADLLLALQPQRSRRQADRSVDQHPPATHIVDLSDRRYRYDDEGFPLEMFVRQTIEATSEGLTTVQWGHATTASSREPDTRVIRGGKLIEKRSNTLMNVTEYSIELDRSLSVGERHVLEVQRTFLRGERPPDPYIVLGPRAPTRRLRILIQFSFVRFPACVERMECDVIFIPTPIAGSTREVEVDSDGTVCVEFADLVGSRAYGARWNWPDLC